MSKKKLAVWAGILLVVIIVIILLLCKQCNGKSDDSDVSETTTTPIVDFTVEALITEDTAEATTSASEEDVLGATKATSETTTVETTPVATSDVEESTSETSKTKKSTKKTTSATETTAEPVEQTTTTATPTTKETTQATTQATTKETTKATTSSKPANQDPAGEPDEPAAPHEPKHYTVSLTGHAGHENDESFPMTVNLSEAAEVETTVNVKVTLHDGDTDYGPTNYTVKIPAGEKSGSFSIPNTLGDDILVSDKSMEGYIDSASDSLNNVFEADSTHRKYFIKDTIDTVTVSLYYYSDEDHVYIGAKMSQPAEGKAVSVKLTSTVLYSLPNIVIPVGETEAELQLNYPMERWTVMIQYLNVQPGVYEHLTFKEGEYVAGEFRPEGN